MKHHYGEAGHHAVVVGGISGIGLAVVTAFEQRGIGVSILDRTVPAGWTAGETGTEVILCDVTCEEEVTAAAAQIYERWGTVTSLINCAGIVEKFDALETPTESWHRVLNVNLTGAFLLSREFGKLMAEQGRGSMVHIASVDAHSAEQGELSYNASKAGLLGMARSFAIELGPAGVRVNTVSPGYVLTPMTLELTAADPDIRNVLNGNFERVPLRRAVTPEEVADACLFLSSPQASGITGQDLIVDGGLMADTYLVPAMKAQARNASTKQH